MNSSINNVIPLKIVNPHPWERTALMKIKFRNTLNVSGIQVYDSDNYEISSQIDIEVDGFREVKFVAENIPPLGNRIYYIKKHDRTANFHLPAEGLLDGNEFYLENDLLRIIVETNGTLTIMDKDEEEDDPSKEKLIIMGEELGNGSIWAGDSFFNYPKLHQFEIDSEIFSMENVKYDLLEASDFGGKIQVTSEILGKSGSRYPITTFLEIEKGEKPTIQIRSLLPSELKDHKVFMVYPTPLKCEIFAEENVLCLWDANQHQGLGIFTQSGRYSSKQNSDGTTTLRVQCLNLTSSGDIVESTVCLVPIKEFNVSTTDPQHNVLFRLAAEYYTPLNFIIE
jgi:hypothetical protein